MSKHLNWFLLKFFCWFCSCSFHVIFSFCHHESSLISETHCFYSFLWIKLSVRIIAYYIHWCVFGASPVNSSILAPSGDCFGVPFKWMSTKRVFWKIFSCETTMQYYCFLLERACDPWWYTTAFKFVYYIELPCKRKTWHFHVSIGFSTPLWQAIE